MFKEDKVGKILLVVVVVLILITAGLIYFVLQTEEGQNLFRRLPEIKTTQEVREESEEFGKNNPEILRLRGKEEPLDPDKQALRDEIIEPENILKIDNGDLLLATEDGYIVEYILSPDTFIVTISEKPIDETKAQAEKWFLDKGFSQDDLCNLGLSFVLGSNLIKEFGPGEFNNRPTGCE